MDVGGRTLLKKEGKIKKKHKTKRNNAVDKKDNDHDTDGVDKVCRALKGATFSINELARTLSMALWRVSAWDK